jgi:hypothetical protein
MKTFKMILLIGFVLALIGCSNQVAPRANAQTPNQTIAQPVLLFTIGMHIEPLGATPSALVKANANTAGQNGSYTNGAIFQRHVQDINTVTSIVEKHGGRMTIQAQTPFTRVAAKSGEKILANLEARGHEIALHFHEDAHLGKNGNALSVETWCAVMKEEINFIHQAGAKNPIRYWSGGNLYAGTLQAAACAGLDVNSDWKNPQTQSTPLELTGLNPWRPAGGSTANDVSAFARHDANGKIIFLPEGGYTRGDFAAMRRSETAGGDEAYFEFLKTSFLQSLASASADKVNVFHFTVHPGEFRGDPKNAFAVIDRFLSEVVDPNVQAGKVKWATLAEMADAFQVWEQTHPGIAPREVQ